MGNKALGSAVRKYREMIGWTQKDLADELGIDRLTVSRWENGVMPRYKHIEALANTFGITTGKLLEGTPCEWVDVVLAKLEFELATVEANLESGLPDNLKSYAIGKKETLNTAIRLMQTEREVNA